LDRLGVHIRLHTFIRFIQLDIRLRQYTLRILQSGSLVGM